MQRVGGDPQRPTRLCRITIRKAASVLLKTGRSSERNTKVNLDSHKVCQRSEKKQEVTNLFTVVIQNPQVRKRVEKLRELRIPSLELKPLEGDSREAAFVCPVSAVVYEPTDGEPLTDQEICSNLDWMLHTIHERGLQSLINFFADQRQKAVA